MYNLLVSADSESWEGEPFEIEFDRYLEYTEPNTKNNYQNLTDSQITELIQFPCIFAYEASCNKDPYFGFIQEVKFRQKRIRIRYKVLAVQKFLTATQLSEMKFELDIDRLELNRTHWAIKKVNLIAELSEKDIELSEHLISRNKIIDITKHHFDVSLSFPGEVRNYVETIVPELARLIGPNAYFYDNNYQAQLARPSLDLLLQSIYKDRSKLIVVFICEKYQEKKWCGIEFSAIRQILFDKQHDKVMYIKMDDGIVDGVFSIDGYIDGRVYNAKQIAGFIKTRIELQQLSNR